MKIFFQIFFAAMIMAAASAIAYSQESDKSVKDQINADITSIKKDLSGLKSQGGDHYAKPETDSCAQSISDAEDSVKKNNFDAASERILDAKFNLLLGYEKTNNGLAKQKYKSSLLYNSAFGFNASFGIFNTFTQSGNFKSKPDHGLAIGLVFEKMFSNRYGIQSGIGYMETTIPVKINSAQPSYMEWHINAVSIPLLMIMSFNTKSVSLNFLAGVNFLHMITSEFLSNDPALETSKADVMRYVNTSLLMASGGINLKYRVASFTDLFIGGIAEISAQNLLGEKNSEIIRLWNLRATAGMMFRTNMFPMSEISKK